MLISRLRPGDFFWHTYWLLLYNRAIQTKAFGSLFLTVKNKIRITPPTNSLFNFRIMKKLIFLSIFILGSFTFANAQPPLPPHPHPVTAQHPHRFPHPPLPPRPPHPPFPPRPPRPHRHGHVIHRHVYHHHVVRHHWHHRPFHHHR